MTHDIRKRPLGAWAVASQRSSGLFGVTVGHGEMEIGFIPEHQIEAYIAAGRKVGDAYDLELLALFEAAAKEVPALKATTIRRRDKSASN